MKISKRLKMTGDMVPYCDLLYDVGCDHAYLPIYLVKTGKVKKAIASDISPVSAEKAAYNTACEGLEDKIEIRCGNGLEPLKENEQPDAILISGMGGVLITEILKGRTEIVKKASYLILQPQHNIDKVRDYIHNIGFKITNEDIAEERGKFYFTILCEQGEDVPYSQKDLLLGKFLTKGKNPLFNDYLRRKISKFENRITSAYDKNPETDIDKLKERLEIMKEVYEKCQNAQTL